MDVRVHINDVFFPLVAAPMLIFEPWWYPVWNIFSLYLFYLVLISKLVDINLTSSIRFYNIKLLCMLSALFLHIEYSIDGFFVVSSEAAEIFSYFYFFDNWHPICNYLCHPGNEQSLGVLKENFPTFNGSVDELFTPFNNIKKMTDGAINEICDFIGELQATLFVLCCKQLTLFLSASAFLFFKDPPYGLCTHWQNLLGDDYLEWQMAIPETSLRGGSGAVEEGLKIYVWIRDGPKIGWLDSKWWGCQGTKIEYWKALNFSRKIQQWI